MAFGKKVQLGGIMAGRRVDEVPQNVFAVSGRINSTWGGGLADMVRSRRLLEVIERDQLFDRVASVGAWFLSELEALASRHPGRVSNVRGRGLMCALDLPGADRARCTGDRPAGGREGSPAAVRPAVHPLPPRADHRGR